MKMALASRKITLKNKRTPHQVVVEFPGFPYLGIWSKPEGAPFVCIEPWHGLADAKEADGDLQNKEGILSLGVEEIFECRYSIGIG